MKQIEMMGLYQRVVEYETEEHSLEWIVQFFADLVATGLAWQLQGRYGREAKAMIDEGYHPMTMYFPLVVHGAMLIEPTETESKQSVDDFIGMMRHLVEKAKAGETERFTGAPYNAPLKRLDETGAARKPILRWTKSEDE